MSSSTLPEPRDTGRIFAFGTLLNLGFVVAEAAAGLWSGSMALLADAGHNLTDVLGLLMGWGAVVLARKKPTERFTYGFRRGGILAALFSGLLLLGAVGAMSYEATGRLADPPSIDAWLVLFTASAGIVVNGLTTWLFRRGRERDVNVRAAFLHMAADTAISVGVALSALFTITTGALWIDPVLSLLIALVILLGTTGLLRDAMRLSLDAVPAGIDLPAVRRHLLSYPQVTALHDLHIWALGPTSTALTVHLVIIDPPEPDLALRINQDLEARFAIDHSTVQFECDPAACSTASDDVV